MEEYEGFTKYRSYVLQLVQEPIGDAVKNKQIDSNFYMEQTAIEFKLFNGFSEIKNIIDSLQLIETFIAIDPPKAEGINNSNYLNYHIHNYFQEMYILKERLKAYLKFIQRKYQKKIDNQLLQKMTKSLSALVMDSLSNITGDTGVRNKHVHIEKYFDDEMKWLASTSFLTEHDGEFELSSKKAYMVAKQKWSSLVKKNNKEVKKLIDLYFSTCYSIITYDNDN